MDRILNFTSIAVQSLETTSGVNIFILKPVKVFSEFLSLLGTYDSIKAFPEFNFLSALTGRTKDILDGALGIVGVLKFVPETVESLFNLRIQKLTQQTLGAVFALKDAQEIFRSFKSADWITLPSRAPLSFISKALQWNISSQRLLLIGTFGTLWQITDACRSIKNRPESVTPIFKIAETISFFAYICFKTLGNNSRTHSWAKFALLAASTGFKMGVFFTTHLPEN